MPIRMAQYGVRHGHAAEKTVAMRTNPEVEFAGVYEPDPEARARVQSRRAYSGVHWFDSFDEVLDDPSIIAVADEDANLTSLGPAREIVSNGKHLWYDKPAGDDWPAFQEIATTARQQNLIVQMGYMFRYDEGFQYLAEWARAGIFGPPFGFRGNMNKFLSLDQRQAGAAHRGGVFYDLAGHLLDQILWQVNDERPTRITTFFRNVATPENPAYVDNALAVFEFEHGHAFIDVAAIDVRTWTRRFEVFGPRGGAVADPIDPVKRLRVCLDTARDGFGPGQQIFDLMGTSRQRTHELELQAFLEAVRGDRPPDRPLEHELLVQETLLRATGRLPGAIAMGATIAEAVGEAAERPKRTTRRRT